MGDRLIPLIMQYLAQGVNAGAQTLNPLSEGIGGKVSPYQPGNIDIRGKVKSADDAAVDFVNYLMGAKKPPWLSTATPGSEGQGTTDNYLTPNAAYVDTYGYDRGLGQGKATSPAGSRLMPGASAPKTLPVKQPSTAAADLAANLTRPNLNLTTATNYPGYGGRGPLTVPTGSGYVPQTYPSVVPGVYTIPNQVGEPTMPWGPTAADYGMQEKWTPAVNGK